MSFLRRAFRLKAWEALFAGVSAAALLTFCLNGAIQSAFVIYFSYLYSTYALIACCLYMTRALRAWRWSLRGRIETLSIESALLSGLYRALSDPQYRARALLWPSLGFNLLFALIKLASGFYYRSPWVTAVGLYYAVLAMMRTSLLRRFLSDSGDQETARRAYRSTALWMLALTVAMAGVMAQAIWRGRHYDYAGVLIYAFALYAFVKIAVASSALIRNRREDNLLLSATKAISFACALMSMLALQTALLGRFNHDGAFARTMNLIAGGVVCAMMLALCVAMLRRGRKTHC